MDRNKREQMIERMVNTDISEICQNMSIGDYYFLACVLRGDGFVGYDKLTDKQVQEEYDDRGFDEV